MRIKQIWVFLFLLQIGFVHGLFATDIDAVSYQDYPTLYRNLDTTLPVGRVSGKASVSSTGAALYQIPIKVPEGVNGIQPQISVNYNSQSKNGVVGYGWSFTAFSAITRVGTTFAYDGHTDYVKMSASDRLMLDDQRLMLVSGNDLTLGAVYLPHIDDHRKIQYTTINSRDAFIVKSKDGLVYEYGSTTDSRITDEENAGVLVWLLSKVTDRYGNYMRYIYADDDNLGDIYIKSIEYSGNTTTGTSPSHRIDFLYSTREEMVVSHVMGTPIAQLALLTGISITTGSTVMKEYKFNYSYDGLYSQLTEIEEYGQNGSRYNSTIISWKDAADSYIKKRAHIYEGTGIDQYTIESGANFNSNGRALFYADFDGDGRCDVMEYPTTIAENDSAVLYVMLSNMQLAKKCVIPYARNEHFFYSDLDGDGDTDLIKSTEYQDRTLHYIYKFNGTTFVNPDNIYIYATKLGLQIGDFNGDGRNELLTADCELYDGNTTLLASGGIMEWDDEYTQNSPTDIRLLDFNGDGKSDILVVSTEGSQVYTLSGNKFVSVPSFDGDIPFSGTVETYADFNGDGCSDIFTRSSGSHDIYTSTSSYFLHRSAEVGGLDYLTRGPLRIADLNGDGRDDILALADNGYLNIWEFDGIRFQRYTVEYEMDENTYNKICNYPSFMGVADFDGNGRCEIFLADHLDAYTIMHLENRHMPHVDCIVDGYNQVVQFEYAPLTSISCYTETNKNLAYPLSRSKFPLYVVKTMLNRDRLGGDYTRTLSYEYEDICIHRAGKGILCFKGITETDESKNIKKKSIYDYLPYSYFPYLKNELLMTVAGDTLSETCYGYSEVVRSNRRYEIQQTNMNQTDYLTGHTVSLLFEQYENGVPKRSVKNVGNGDVIETTTMTYQHVDNANLRLFGLPTIKEVSTQRRGKSAWWENTYYTYDESYAVSTKETYVYDGNKKTLEETFTYDDFGNIITKSIKPYNAANPLTNTYTYSTNGVQLCEVRNPLGIRTTYQYNGIGQLTKMYDHNGNATSYLYDDFGNPIRTLYPENVIETDSIFWATNVPGALYGIKKGSTVSPMTISYFNCFGKEVRKSTQLFDGSMTHVDNVYDWDMRLAQTSLPFKGSEASLWNIYTYDKFDRLTQVNYASGKTDKYSYSGNAITETKNGIATTRTYDGTGALLSSKTSAGTINYNYLSNDNVSTISCSNVPIVRFGYDNYGRRTSIYTQDTGTRETTYDEAGNVSSEVDANGKRISYSYDMYSRLVRKETSDGLSTTYTYDNYGYLVQESTNNGVRKIYEYDRLGRILEEYQIDNYKNSSNVGYNKFHIYTNGLLTETIHSLERNNTTTSLLGIETFLYSNGYLVQIGRKNNGVSEPLWTLTGQNEFGQITNYTTGPLQHTNTYNNFSILTRITTAKNSERLQDFRYVFNPSSGNLTRRTDVLHNIIENFSYDQHNRLRSANDENYSYNMFGDITSHSKVGTYNYTGGLYSVTGITTVENSRLLDTEQQITYDAQMRPTRIATDMASAQLKYDGSGNRIQMIDSLLVSSYIVGGLPQPPRNKRVITYYGDKYEKIEDYVNNDIKKILYLGGDAYSAPAAYVNHNDSLKLVYICRDHLGSITHIIDENGTLIQELSYDAWGNLRDPATQSVYAFGDEPILFLGRGYTGHEHLNHYALINMNARLYDPIIGRFLSPDTYTQLPDNLQSYNLYSYCMNNPLRYVDQSGEVWWVVAIAAVVGGGLNIASNWDHIDNVWDGLGYFGVGALAGVVGAATFTGAIGVVGVSGVAGGFLAGAASGFTSGAILGGGNGIVGGEDFMGIMEQMTFSAVTGMVGGAASGAVTSGVAAYLQGQNVWTGADIAPGRNAFSFKNTPVSESIKTTSGDFLPDEIPSQVKPDKPMSAVEEAPNHKMSPHEKGKIGVERAIEEFKAEGGTVYSKEVTIEIESVRNRLDFVGEKDGVLHLFEVKNGPHAGMTTNQKINIPKLQQNYKFIPRGNNASAVQGFTPGKIYDRDYVIIYKHYLK